MKHYTLVAIISICNITPFFACQKNQKYNRKALNNGLYAAAGHGDINWAKELLKKGAEINGTQAKQRAFCPLLNALLAGHLQFAQWLWAQGATIECSSTTNETILTGLVCELDLPMRSKKPFYAAIKWLLAKNPDLEEKNSHGETAFYIACGINDLRAAILLSQAGADINFHKIGWLSPLLNACIRSPNTIMVQYLLEQGANNRFDDSIWKFLDRRITPPEIITLLKAKKRPPIPEEARAILIEEAFDIQNVPQKLRTRELGIRKSLRTGTKQ